MLRFVKISFLSLGAILALLIFLLGSVGAVLWLKPGLVVNKSMIERFQGRLESLLGLEWKGEWDVFATSKSFREKYVEFNARDFCVNLQNPPFSFCFEKVALKAVAQFSGLSVPSLVISEALVLAKPFVIDLNQLSQSPTKNTEDEKGFAWSSLDFIELQKLHIHVPSFKLIFNKEDKKVSPSLLSKLTLSNFSQEAFALNAEAKATGIENFREARAKIRSNALVKIRDIFKAQHVQALVKLSPVRLLDLDLRGVQVGSEDVELGGNLAFIDRDLTTKLKVVYKKQGPKMTLNFGGSVTLPDLIPGAIAIKDCSLAVELPRENSPLPLKEGRFSCDPSITSEQLVFDGRYRNFLPPKLGVRISAEASSDVEQKNLFGEVRVKGVAGLEDLTRGSLAIGYKFKFPLRESDQTQEGEAQNRALVDANIEIVNFRKFARVANASGILIPSPVNVLNGTVALKGKGAFNLAPIEGKLDLELSSDLQSQNQALDLLARGGLRFSRCNEKGEGAGLDINLIAKRMRIKLPDIDYKSPPTLLPDKRFVHKDTISPKVEKTRCPLKYKFAFSSPNETPVLIEAPVLKNAVPLHVSIKAESEKELQGYLRIKNYTAELFRRKGRVNNFDLDLATKILTGQIQVEYTDYKILINLSGTTQNLGVEFESDPPMDRNQVMAILVFGKPLDALNEDQAGSVEMVDAAAKDGALTLASMYLFASTPIESVGYNPHTNGLSAKVRLSSGTSLNVGANQQGLSDVGFTKRLSKRWRINTTVNDPIESEQRSASTLLEWFVRF